ncbi:MAG TPA: 2-C-methyl-D-erythritol 4-phosphate cytidylyltransferase [Phycisphaerae bacterium]|nr:2-C-methyl-D-erythritol 4-phosphate cytidylyltransferase [Phycisphaerae bacterium]
MKKVSVILPAAGAGVRFGGQMSKIFASLAGEAVFLRTLGLFRARADVCQIQLVVSPETLEHINANYPGHPGLVGVDLTPGGATRTQSVRNALANLPDVAELVCIHDAVRPCVTGEMIDRVIAEAADCGAAILGRAVTSTLKRVRSDGVIEKTVSRENLFEAQTPQVFSSDLITRAYDAEISATDDASLIEAMGGDVKVVESGPENIKITTPADLALAEAILQSSTR